MNQLQKYLLVSVCILLVGGWVIFSYSNKTKSKAVQYSKSLSNLQQDIKTQNKKIQQDKFGGILPEDTYRYFIDSLKKQDINLASKYFTLDTQNKYTKLLLNIKKGKQWQSMMNDLLNSTTKGKYADDNNYIIPVINKEGNLITTIRLIKINHIWKIIEF